MKKLKLLLLILVLSTTAAFTQILITNTMWHSTDKQFIELVNHFNLSYGTNKDIAWYSSPQFNDVFKRISDITYGYTTNGQYFRAANYFDKSGEILHIQYFPYEEAIRATYIDGGLYFEFFK
jgi:hypothetical protein